MRAAILFLIMINGLYELEAQTDRFTSSPLKIGTNYRIYPGNVSQTEAFITKSPVDENTFFVTCNTIMFIPFFISEGIYVTSNAGTTWYGSDTCKGDPIGYHGGDPGITIDKNGTFILTRLGRTPFVGLYSHFSTDQGRTWSSQQVISTDDLERAALMSDAVAASFNYGQTYAAWVTFAQPFPVMFAFTDNGAQKWSVPKQINQPPNRCAGGDIAIGPNGEVYLCWAGVTDFSPFKEILVGFASSSDGGANWNVNENAFSINGISGVLASKNNIRVNSLPGIAVDTTHGPRRGWIYIVTDQKNSLPAGTDPDVILYRSTDGGSTWSTGIRVNQDPLNNGKTQFFPSVHVDKSGAVDIIFYDDRNTTIDSSGVFFSRSLDGGNTWSEFEISDHHFMPSPIGGLGQGYQGDNIDLSSNHSKILPVWMDNSSGIYQLWTVPVEFSDINHLEETNSKQGGAGIKQAFPNPTKSLSEIRYQITVQGSVSLKVFNLTGKEMATLVNAQQRAGHYSVKFDASNLPPGIYFYRLRAGNFVSVWKLVKLEESGLSD